MAPLDAVQVRATWLLPGVATRLVGAIGGAGGTGVALASLLLPLEPAPFVADTT